MHARIEDYSSYGGHIENALAMGDHKTVLNFSYTYIEKTDIQSILVFAKDMHVYVLSKSVLWGWFHVSLSAHHVFARRSCIFMKSVCKCMCSPCIMHVLSAIAVIARSFRQ